MRAVGGRSDLFRDISRNFAKRNLINHPGREDTRVDSATIRATPSSFNVHSQRQTAFDARTCPTAISPVSTVQYMIPLIVRWVDYILLY
jgi:hypothetical protein